MRVRCAQCTTCSNNGFVYKEGFIRDDPPSVGRVTVYHRFENVSLTRFIGEIGTWLIKLVSLKEIKCKKIRVREWRRAKKSDVVIDSRVDFFAFAFFLGCSFIYRKKIRKSVRFYKKPSRRIQYRWSLPVIFYFWFVGSEMESTMVAERLTVKAGFNYCSSSFQTRHIVLDLLNKLHLSMKPTRSNLFSFLCLVSYLFWITTWNTPFA